MLEADPDTGATKVLASETGSAWVNLSKNFKALKSGDSCGGSERSGFNQIYRYAEDGTLIGPATRGPGLVSSLDCIGEEAGLIYFAGWRTSPLERHLFVAPPEGGEPRRLTEGEGSNAAV